MIVGGGSKKRQRVATTTSRINFPSSFTDIDFSTPSDGTLTDLRKPLGLLLPSNPGAFNDPLTADVILLLHIESSPFDPDPISDDGDLSAIKLHVHSNILRRCKYFAAFLSDRWQTKSSPPLAESSDGVLRLNLRFPASAGSMETHLTVLQLLYTSDFAGAITSPSVAVSIIPVALELLFDDCVRACVRFLEAVPWSEDEEKGVLSVIHLLRQDESQELLARVSPANSNSSEEMLHSLIMSAIHGYPSVATVKAFVAKVLRDFSSRDSVRRVLDQAFGMCLKTVKESLEEYSSPALRGDHDETEAIQRLNLHTAMVNGRHLLWLIERMIELRVAETAVKEWSEQSSFTGDLQWAFRDDAWRNIAPGLPTVLLRCTFRLANAVAAGSILADRQVRSKLVKHWLPVLIVCRDNVSATPSSPKLLYQELEETFLRIISTLPMSDAQILLQQCLSFSTRNVEDCPHLVSAFDTWFRRANRPPPYDDSAS